MHVIVHCPGISIPSRCDHHRLLYKGTTLGEWYQPQSTYVHRIGLLQYNLSKVSAYGLVWLYSSGAGLHNLNITVPIGSGREGGVGWTVAVLNL
jgi:hypothetical protein